MTKPKTKVPFRDYKWNERTPVYISEEDLTEQQRYRLMQSEHFCMIPWIHMHAWPTGEAYPCCLGEGQHPVGNLKEKTIAELWNDQPYREMRQNMLADRPSKECTRCYEQEKAGFSSMRNSTNRHFAQHIDIVDQTLEDGTFPDMKFRYWDIRFSNTCNLKCRSCGSIFSSRWYDDDVKLHGKPLRDRILFAGRHEMDIWEQMEDQIQYLEQIYFAGGEPLIMEEHYRILDKLIELGKTDVKLTYNTNLTEFRFKKKHVLEYWKQFKNVSVAASLDGMGDLAELVRSGTKWAEVEQNIRDLKRECPHIDFLISPTLSIMNVWQLPKFHRYMVEQGYLKHGDLNVNILQSPKEYRIDILPSDIKAELVEIYQQHIAWCEPHDSLTRATGGFQSAIQFMLAEDNTQHLPKFWSVAKSLDTIRKESILEVIPELQKVKQYE